MIPKGHYKVTYKQGQIDGKETVIFKPYNNHGYKYNEKIVFEGYEFSPHFYYLWNKVN